MKRVDARGLSCPEPVIQTKMPCVQSSQYEVLVDNVVAKENVSRLQSIRAIRSRWKNRAMISCSG